MIHPTRIRPLNDQPIVQSARYVLYWMQQSQRTRFNHALELAIARANELKLPLVVGFGLMDGYPDANERHYAFMLQGLGDVKVNLAARGIKFILRHGQPDGVALELSRDAALVVCDRGYLRHQKRWRDELADHAACAVVQVESDVVIPVEVTSDKREFAARTIRPKIHVHLKQYLVPLQQARVKIESAKLHIKGNAVSLDQLEVDRSVGAVDRFHGGENQAAKLLKSFIKERLADYAQARNEPAAQATSLMSPYLHFGQISPLEIALATEENDAYIEELIVRRELGMNFVHFTPDYDSYDALPDWAKRTLESHASDQRQFTYSRDQLARAKTHDRWWNAAMIEMTRTGFMHNYMRMYWGKKILEWSKTPRQAFETTLWLNNRFLLDGRDPVSYANVGWIFGLHDRPWIQRPIFGQIRYMNAAGLERKFDMQAYEKWCLAL